MNSHMICNGKNWSSYLGLKLMQRLLGGDHSPTIHYCPSSSQFRQPRAKLKLVKFANKGEVGEIQWTAVKCPPPGGHNPA
eukprot:scaffold139607_cov64-Cyclotella_meneghiniana.AAC.1